MNNTFSVYKEGMFSKCKTGKEVNDTLEYLNNKMDDYINNAKYNHDMFWINKLMIRFSMPKIKASKYFYQNGPLLRQLQYELQTQKL